MSIDIPKQVFNEKYHASEIRQDVAKIIGIPVCQISDDENLYDLGLDSMRLVDLILEWQGKGISIDFPHLAKKTTLKEFTNILNGIE